MPYIRMLNTLRGKPTCNNTYNLEPVKFYYEKAHYYLPLNLYNLWKRGIDYIDAIPPDQFASQKTYSNGKVHKRTAKRLQQELEYTIQLELI